MIDGDRLRRLADAVEPRAGLTGLFFLSPGPGVTELLLIRHAQVEAGNPTADLPLTPIGREQAEVLAQYLRRDKIDAVYASSTHRARETAEPVAHLHGLPIQTVDALRDLDILRPFEQPFLEMLAQEFGAENVEAVLARMREEKTLDAMAPFIEASATFRARVSEGIETILAARPGQRVAVFTHGPVIMAYVAILMGSPRDFAIHPKLTSITRILAREDMRTLDFVNTRPHFELA